MTDQPTMPDRTPDPYLDEQRERMQKLYAEHERQTAERFERWAETRVAEIVRREIVRSATGADFSVFLGRSTFEWCALLRWLEERNTSLGTDPDAEGKSRPFTLVELAERAAAHEACAMFKHLGALRGVEQCSRAVVRAFGMASPLNLLIDSLQRALVALDEAEKLERGA